MKLSDDELLVKLAAAKNRVTIGGRYQHYKFPDKTYCVLDIVIGEASQEPCVIYRAEYGAGIPFMRPFSEFMEVVQWNGAMVPRFTHIE